jgi:lysophospholipase L1-like esterase
MISPLEYHMPRSLSLSLLTVCACLAWTSPLLTAAEGETKPAVKPAATATDVPAMKLDKEGKPNANFLARHEKFLARAKSGPIDVLFIGDSITEGWEKKGKEVWAKHYEPLKAANFGIGGDRTEHVLWRFAHGELDGISPKVVVLMIGTNNNGSAPADILKGDLKVVSEIRAKLPQAKLLVLGIFPRGADATDAKRQKMVEVNKGLAKLDDGKHVRYLDISAKFLAPDGVLPKDVMPDLLHPNEKGYAIWAEAMNPLLTEMLAAK